MVVVCGVRMRLGVFKEVKALNEWMPVVVGVKFVCR